MSFKIESNAESVYLSLLKSVQLADDSLEEILRLAASDSVVMVAHRVQQSGLSANGSRLTTKATLRMGAYSKAHAKRRAERGLQIGMVDLTMDGTLFKAWDVLSTSPAEAVAGFSDSEQADIATYLEEYYDEPIFSLSDSEQDRVSQGMMDTVIDKLKK